MNNKSEQLTTTHITFGILLVLLFTGGFIGADRFIKFLNKTEDKSIDDRIGKLEQALSPYQEKDSLNKAVVINDYVNSTANGSPTQNFKKRVTTSGIFEHGYVYIKSSSNGKALDKNSDVYLKLQNHHTGEQLGGHLVTSKSLTTPKSDMFTEMLFDLSDVKYKQSTPQSDYEIISGDWLKLLNQTKDRKTILGFSSTTSEGEIMEISIYYKCLDGESCSVSITDL